MRSPNPVLRYSFAGFAGLAAVALGLLMLGADNTDDWFSWTIQPPLSAAALGAFYGAALILFMAGARAPGAVAVAARQIAPPVLVIATTLLVVTLVHLDKFEMDSVFGVFWLCAYIVAPPLVLWGILGERDVLAGSLPGTALPRSLRIALGSEGAIMVAASGVLLFAPETAADLWPWQLTPLVGRAFGAFTLGVGMVALIVARDRVLGATGIALAYAALGALQLLVVALHSADLGDDSVATAVYLSFCGLVLGTGLYGVRSASRAAALTPP